MFSFTTEQKIVDISGIKIGGQPGCYPTVLFGGLFFKDVPDYKLTEKVIKNIWDAHKIISCLKSCLIFF